jgi:1-piperideine-2-carboxylate/1-pyrroline-2-carboxylate reductase [NAD(P)H]
MGGKLSAEETASRLPYLALADTIAAALLGRHKLYAPERSVVQFRYGSLLVMPAASDALTITKLVTVHPENRRRGLPTIQGEIVVMRSDTGVRLGILDGATVTQRRTAALSLLAARTLAPLTSGPLLIIGAGVQAKAHLEAFQVGLGVKKVFIASRDPAPAEALVAHAQALGLDAQVVKNPAEAVSEASLIVTATTSQTPILVGPLRRDAMVCAVGSFQPKVAEVAAEVISNSRVVVDTPEAAEAEAGDLIQAADAGLWTWAAAEQLEDLLATPGVAADRPTVFKSVGHAIFDLAAAHVAFGIPIDPTPA